MPVAQQPAAPRQYFGAGVYTDSKGAKHEFTFFHDHFGDNFDDYIAMSYCNQDWYEDPYEVELMFRRLVKGDHRTKRHKRFVTLKDLSSDGKVYV